MMVRFAQDDGARGCSSGRMNRVGRSQRRRRVLQRAAERPHGRGCGRSCGLVRAVPASLAHRSFVFCPSCSLLARSLSPPPVVFVSAGLIKRSAGNVYKDKDYKRAVVTLIPKFEGDTMGWPENYT